MSTVELSSKHAPSKPGAGAGARRALDFALAALALVLLSPLFAIAALGVFVQGGRPILFSQLRLGRGGRPFVMYKFRKFGRDCGSTGCPLTLEGDPRLTSIGSVLQATKIDELPQLWNVLRGDMSLVGPRPESLAFADCFVNGYERILEHKPGVIGPSQVLFRNESSLYPQHATPDGFYREVLFPTKAEIDLAYFSTRTLAMDMLWLVRSLFAVLGWVPDDASRLRRDLLGTAVSIEASRHPGLSCPKIPFESRCGH